MTPSVNQEGNTNDTPSSRGDTGRLKGDSELAQAPSNQVDTLIEQLKAIEDHDIFSFWDNDFDGSCPCFGGTKKVDGHTVSVHGRCWRVSDNDQDLYVWGDVPKRKLQAIAKETKRALDATNWHNPYTIIYEDF